MPKIVDNALQRNGEQLYIIAYGIARKIGSGNGEYRKEVDSKEAEAGRQSYLTITIHRKVMQPFVLSAI